MSDLILGNFPGKAALATVIYDEVTYAQINWPIVRDTVDGFWRKLPGTINIDRIADAKAFLPNDIFAPSHGGFRLFGPRNYSLGNNHRIYDGHDMIVDGYKTYKQHGIVRALKHVGHIGLTDFPTKAGIPYPIITRWVLEHYPSIDPKWLRFFTINMPDGVIACIAIPEGTSDLLAALHGNLEWGWGTFFDTFVEGTFEIYVGWRPGNWPLMIAGVENELAGIISLRDYLLDPRIFGVPVDTLIAGFGSGFLLGSALGYFMARGGPFHKKISAALKGGAFSGVMSDLFLINNALGFATLAATALCRLAAYSAKLSLQYNQKLYSVDRLGYEKLVQEYLFFQEGTERVSFFKTFENIYLLGGVSTPQMEWLDRETLLDDQDGEIVIPYTLAEEFDVKLGIPFQESPCELPFEICTDIDCSMIMIELPEAPPIVLAETDNSLDWQLNDTPKFEDE
ncbi:MAG: hypothetical protein ACOYOS_14745 [Syntrophales bacterium]